MNKNERVVGFPQCGPYSGYFKSLFENLGLNVLDFIPITDETIKFGVRHAPEMFCFPYKAVLGNFMELVENGANTLVMFSSCGKCKERHYYKLAEQKLEELGCKFEMVKIAPKDLIPLPLPGFMEALIYLSGFNKLKAARILYNGWKTVARAEKMIIEKPWGDINIGLTGEIYTVLEPDINHRIREQLEKMGATVQVTLSIREVITGAIWRDRKRRALRKMCWDYMDPKGDPGGHGLHSIEDTLLWGQQGIDGIIHITPLSCHPEILVEDAIDKICKDKKIPLLRIKIDETISPLNVGTRVETFFELIKRKKVVADGTT